MTNDAMDTIAQLPSLKELRLSENALTGELSVSILGLKQVEILDLSGNKLASLPQEIGSLRHLRILNVSKNQLKSLPMTSLCQVPLQSLLASKNNMSGTFFTQDTVMSKLQDLDISVNSITLFASMSVSLPVIRELNVGYNRIAALPNISTWTTLTTLYAENNKLKDVPEGFVELTSLRTADFSSNDFPRLDSRIGLMAGLDKFGSAANPIRERKFLTMSTSDLKRDLKARLGVDEPDQEVD
jgi:Leucine-rich repeat (LRR) protein